MFILLGLRLSSASKDHALQCEDGPYASADASKHHKLHFHRAMCLRRRCDNLIRKLVASDQGMTFHVQHVHVQVQDEDADIQCLQRASIVIENAGHQTLTAVRPKFSLAPHSNAYSTEDRIFLA
jgi:hypothetical protein